VPADRGSQKHQWLRAATALLQGDVKHRGIDRRGPMRRELRASTTAKSVQGNRKFFG
jgi:hypothetical protein